MAKKTAKGHRGPGARRRPKRDNAGASTRQTSKGQGPRRESRDNAQGHPRFRNAAFTLGAAALPQMPPDSGREVALGGRSNAGKSSALNALTGHGGLARVSKTPGRTQQINFFRLGNALMLVDLPGYGYAKASKQKIGSWTALIHDYLLGRPNLRRLCLLVDSRHGLKDTDLTLMAELFECRKGVVPPSNLPYRPTSAVTKILNHVTDLVKVWDGDSILIHALHCVVAIKADCST